MLENPELQGLTMLPLVNFADKKDHECWIKLRDQTGKDFTGWFLHVKINFKCH